MRFISVNDIMDGNISHIEMDNLKRQHHKCHVTFLKYFVLRFVHSFLV